MSQAEASPGSTRQNRSGATIDHGRERGSHLPAKDSVFIITGAGLLATLCIALLLAVFAAIAFAEAHEDENTAYRVAALPVTGASELTTAFDPTALPSLDSIDARTDITAFLHIDAPTELRLAALRRAWTVDPAIRDFRGMQENGWDFDRPDGMPGFGELGSEVDVRQMVAQILGNPARFTLARTTSLLGRRP